MTNINPEMKSLLDYAISQKASDLHLAVDVAPTIRVDGKLLAIPNLSTLTEAGIERIVYSLISPIQKQTLELKKDLDFSFGYDAMRFRTNIFFEKGSMSAAFRLITAEIRSIDALGLPPILEKFTESSQGLVVITGPTGHGKSTTLAALVDAINSSRAEHIITIEDPIEYLFTHKKSIICQREVGSDAISFNRALRASLREDPNVILVGEMRDLESVEATLTLAETGHLVFTTLHTNSAAQTPDRIIDVFPPHQQTQIRIQLANVLLGVVSQRLLPKIGGGRVIACEIMMASSAVRSLIREDKTHQLTNVIQTSASEGMIALDKVLAELVNKGDITLDDALSWCLDQKSFKMMVY